MDPNEADEGGLLSIGLGDSDGTPEPEPHKEEDRTGQTEEQFQEVRRNYLPKLDDGEVRARLAGMASLAFGLSIVSGIDQGAHIADTTLQIWKRIKLPLGEVVTKSEAEELVAAVEELYFFRRYDEAARFVHKVIGEGIHGGLDRETRKLLASYEQRCLDKLKTKT
jgi:hypothetical protein